VFAASVLAALEKGEVLLFHVAVFVEVQVAGAVTLIVIFGMV